MFVWTAYNYTIFHNLLCDLNGEMVEPYNVFENNSQ